MHFTHYGFQKIQKGIVEYYIFQECLIFISKNAHGIEHLSLIWQSYINAILGCLQSREHCEAITDDLLLFTPSKRAHMANFEDLLKALLNNGLKIPPKSVSYLKQNCNTWGMSYL